MKKAFLLIFVIIIALIPLCLTTAFADGETYYVVGEQEIKFHISNVTLVEKFSIPKGYAFVLIERNSAGSGYAKVKYSNLVGYVSDSDLAKCTETTAPSHATPELVLQFVKPIAVYDSPDELTAKPVSFNGNALFLGEYKKDGVTKCYAFRESGGTNAVVYYVWRTGVSNATDIDNLLNPPVITPGGDETPLPGDATENQKETPKNKTVLRIILVLGIVIPAFIIILIIFKSGKKTQKIEREVADDSDRFDDY